MPHWSRHSSAAVGAAHQSYETTAEQIHTFGPGEGVGQVGWILGCGWQVMDVGGRAVETVTNSPGCAGAMVKEAAWQLEDSSHGPQRSRSTHWGQVRVWAR
jgi:hypothetical protein